MMNLLDENEDAEFNAIAAGVETHGVSHMLEEKYKNASVTWYVDLAQVYQYYNKELDYILMDGDEFLGGFPGIVLNGIKSALKPEGRLILRVSNAAWYGRLFDILKGENPDITGEKSLSHPYMKDEIANILEKTGFEAEFSSAKADVPARDMEILNGIIYQLEDKLPCADINEFTNKYYLIKASQRMI